MTNFVVPLLLAAKRSPEFNWLTMSEALEPIPPLTDKGAMVFDAEPMRTPLFKSEERMVLPLPAEVRVKLPFPEVVIVDAPAAPTVIVPPDAPTLRAVAAPAKLTVEAVEFIKSNEAEEVNKDVAIVGEVLKTATPEPVSSERILESSEEVAEPAVVVNCFEPLVTTKEEASREVKAMVPEEVSPVKPVSVPLATRLEPFVVRAGVPPGASVIFPVVELPRVSVWFEVVARVPSAVK